MVALLIPVMLAAALLPAGASVPPGSTETWYRLVAADGAGIGYSRHEARQGRQGRETVSEQEIRLDSGDGPTRISERTLVREDRSGRPVSISEHVRIGRSWSRLEVRIGPNRARIVRSTPTDSRTATVELPPGVRFDAGSALLRGWDPDRVPRLEFDNLNVGAMTVERVVIERAPGSTAAADGGILALRRRYEDGELRAVARLSLTRDGRLRRLTQPMFGTSATTELTDRETALRPHPPYRLLQSVRMKSPVRISAEAMAGRIRYTFAFRDALAFPVPQTGEQRVAEISDGVAIDICQDCGPDLPADKAALDRALKPTAWMQSDHPRLRAIARPIARLKQSDAHKMAMLAKEARPYLERIEFAGHFSALETLSRRAGDCTEAAVLLAALGRAAGIPTRVASGLVYSRQRYHGVANVFLPHSWTLAYVDGRWRSFDAALDAFDATHIALTVGDGDPRSMRAAGQLAGLLLWKGMAEVRLRPDR